MKISKIIFILCFLTVFMAGNHKVIYSQSMNNGKNTGKILEIFKLKCKSDIDSFNELKKYTGDGDREARELAQNAVYFYCSNRPEIPGAETLKDLYKKSSDKKLKAAANLGLIELKNTDIFIDDLENSANDITRTLAALSLIKINTEQVKPYYGKMLDALLGSLNKYRDSADLSGALFGLAVISGDPGAVKKASEFYGKSSASQKMKLRSIFKDAIKKDNIPPAKFKWLLDMLYDDLMEYLYNPDSAKIRDINLICGMLGEIGDEEIYIKACDAAVSVNKNMPAVMPVNDKIALNLFIKRMEDLNAVNEPEEYIIGTIKHTCFLIKREPFYPDIDYAKIEKILLTLKNKPWLKQPLKDDVEYSLFILGDRNTADSVIGRMKNGDDERKLILDYFDKYLNDMNTMKGVHTERQKDQMKKIIGIIHNSAGKEEHNAYPARIMKLINYYNLSEYFPEETRAFLKKCLDDGSDSVFQSALINNLLLLFPDDPEISKKYTVIAKDFKNANRLSAIRVILMAYLTKEKGIERFVSDVLSDYKAVDAYEVFELLLDMASAFDKIDAIKDDLGVYLNGKDKYSMCTALIAGVICGYRSEKDEIWSKILEILKDDKIDKNTSNIAVSCMAQLCNKRTETGKYIDKLFILLAMQFERTDSVNSKRRILKSLQTAKKEYNMDIPEIRNMWEKACNDENKKISEIAKKYFVVKKSKLDND